MRMVVRRSSRQILTFFNLFVFFSGSKAQPTAQSSAVSPQNEALLLLAVITDWRSTLASYITIACK